MCLTCLTDFDLNSNNKCIKSTPTCAAGSYAAPLADSSGYACVKCPSSCATCGLADTSSLNS